MSAQFVILDLLLLAGEIRGPGPLTYGKIVAVLLIWRLGDWPIRCREALVGARHVYPEPRRAVPAHANEPLLLRLPAQPFR
jgi:hypothetical protein